MSRAGCRRGQVEPLAALAALFAVCVGLSTYAVVLTEAGARVQPERDVATPTLAAVHDAVTERGVVHPDRLRRALVHDPTGWRLAVVLHTSDRRWAVGPSWPSAAERAERPVSVRLGPGRVSAGRLRVVVWR
jgi:hypothetical protein